MSKTSYFNYLNNEVNMSLMTFADLCQLEHPELLSPNFKQTELLKNEELNKSLFFITKIVISITISRRKHDY